MTPAMTTETRKVTVRLFAAARERVGSENVTVSLSASGTVRDLRAALAESFPPLRPLVPYLLFAIGNDYAPEDAIVPPDGEIAAFPPVSGG